MEEVEQNSIELSRKTVQNPHELTSIDSDQDQGEAFP